MISNDSLLLEMKNSGYLYILIYQQIQKGLLNDISLFRARQQEGDQMHLRLLE